MCRLCFARSEREFDRLGGDLEKFAVEKIVDEKRGRVALIKE